MKKMILLLGIVLLTQSIQAQDTLIMKDGSRALAQIIGMDTENIRYKSWTNLSGPIWVKSRQDVQMIKRASRVVLEQGETLNFTDCTNIPDGACLSGNEIVGQIDGMYARTKDLGVAKEEFVTYLTSLPSCIKKKCIYKYYLKRYEQSRDMGVVDYMLQDGETYLLLGGEDQMAEVVETLVLMYAADGKEEKMTWWMDYFKAYSEENDNLFAEYIKRLENTKEGIVHPHYWEDELKGKWVMLNRVSNNGTYGRDSHTECPLILDVHDVSISTGAYLVVPSQKVPLRQENPLSLYSGQINNSQSIFFNGRAYYSLFQFASMNISDGRWKTELAHIIMDNTRETSEEMRDLLRRSKASPEEILKGEVAVAVTTATINLLASNMNTSSKTNEVYNVLVYPNKPNVMNAFVSHVSAKTITPADASQNPRVIYNQYVKDKKSYMVRWEESDSVCFVSANGNPITLHPVDKNNPVLDEYWRIGFKHSILNPTIFLPLLGCDALAAAAIVHGIQLMKASNARDEYGNKIPNGMGGFVYDKEMDRKGFYYMYGGAMVCMVANMATFKIIGTHRNRAYNELNLRNMEKLRQKASVSLSMTPTYCPEDNAIGANINLSF